MKPNSPPPPHPLSLSLSLSLSLTHTHTHQAVGGGGLLDFFNGLYGEVPSVLFLLLQASGI